MCLAIPGKIVELDRGEAAYAVVSVSGVRRRVNVQLLRDEPLEEDDWVLIHVGFAMSRISEADARAQIRLLEMMGEAQAAADEVAGYGFRGDPTGDGADPNDEAMP